MPRLLRKQEGHIKVVQPDSAALGEGKKNGIEAGSAGCGANDERNAEGVRVDEVVREVEHDFCQLAIEGDGAEEVIRALTLTRNTVRMQLDLSVDIPHNFIGSDLFWCWIEWSDQSLEL